MADTKVRIQIGFDGGHVAAELVSAADADGLIAALKAGDALYEADVEDGRLAVALARVAYVKRLAREQKVGF
jgi:hypothetical protein